MSFFMSPSLQSFEMDGQLKDNDCGYIQNAAAAITSALSKYHNSTILQAVVEARVEMQAECRAEGYLVPVLGVVFSLLWVFCLVVCVWWTRKRKKERERAALSEDTTVNNQLEPLRSNTPKENRDKDIQYECKKLIGPSDRTCDEADEEEQQLEEDEEMVLGLGDNCLSHKCPIVGAQDRSTIIKAEVMCMTRSGPVKAPHRTAYNPKDNRCKNLNAAKFSEDITDLCV
ncbi:PREDICTED: protein jagged-2-like [Poecilia mexicana]|uniref:protein jagged-2-like n=1 Tax=Poecilia mexicana TaxID=48701 RepID=UPI00072E157C|nr:PREDICTED: protein jagged-2-like [Poecilia mexicana]